ncbi:MAG: hypothetical protein HC806_10260, partial [Anaerolineae bacterium]|nr:hypothetical protein [Anaerolineae bacterium]
DPNDNFGYWNGTQWVQLSTEDYRTPYFETGHGPHATTPEGMAWKIYDSDGSGYFIEMDTGQFGGRGDTPFVYATQFKTGQGDTDMGLIGTCCNTNHVQGPNNYIGAESVTNQNLVLWYVSQAYTDATTTDGNGLYCWTVYPPAPAVPHPCFMGPMFHPIRAIGTVNLQGRADHSGAIVVATDNNANSYTTLTDASGNFSFAIPSGTYDLTIEAEQYLDAEILDVVITTAVTTNLPVINLLGGDVDDNDSVNIIDLAFIGSHYQLVCASGAWDARADINGDCVVNIQDLTIASGNYKKNSPVP